MTPDSGLEAIEGVSIYPRSTVSGQDTEFFLARRHVDGSKILGVRGDDAGFRGTRHQPSGALLGPLSAVNAAALRARLPWLQPALLGLRTSAGFGDRLGLATPGHMRAVRRVCGESGAIAPVFAQQSVRENQRTGRTPQQVLDDATWGAFEEGWREPWGADADHLKTTGDIDAFAEAGFTLFTIDPGDHVDDGVESLDAGELEAKVAAVPWLDLEDTQAGLERRYLVGSVDLEGRTVVITREQLWRAAVKYGRAVAHTAAMYRHLLGSLGEGAFELEVSVDETSSPTRVAEHIYIAGELRRLGVEWVSLAPRFVGRFEKGVDYIGDLETFSAELALHAAVARVFGPYKLSLHSGSDKFSIYPLIARLTAGAAGPLVHVKTAGTSYLEALRTMTRVNVDLFRLILAHARERYETDRATYHVSARLDIVPAADTVSDGALPHLLEQFDVRQVLHVTYGSALDRFGDRLKQTLRANEEMHLSTLETHFAKHLAPFAAG